ncbi:MAG: hypothetical protein JWN45_1088 [Acidobacteriaceae bacterium]|nr:hypothetical protein [Acidobacteriaceae bacterium]
MRSQRLLCLSVVVVLLVCLIAPVSSLAQTKPPSGAKAGSITALLPVATIDRGTGRTKTTVEAKKGDDIIWNDLIKTQKGGRARITLTDTSVLSLGSQAELRVLKHDSRTQQTALQLAYGRVRAEVASVTRDGGKFELRTPTAVAGVIGTDFGTDSSIPGVTTFLCIAGIVTVGNVDAKIPGTVPCPAGSTTSVATGLPPTPPKPATQEQIQKLIQDTSAAVISSISPPSAFQGKTLAATVSGTKMTGITEVTISGSGVTVTMSKPSTETGLELSVQIAADAVAGPRTINFTKSNGQSASSIFTVLAPPKEGATVDIAALQKAYLDIIEQERLSEIAGLNAIGVGIQQSAGEALALLIDQNKKSPNPVDQDKIEQNMGQDVAPLLSAMDLAGKKVNEDAANAAKDFVTRTTKQPPLTPAAITEIFDKANAALLDRFKLTHDALGKLALSTNAKFVGTPDWLKSLQADALTQKIAPKTDSDERSYDQGLMAGFDASRSKGSGNSSIAGFSWVLCDPSYKPQVVGVPLPSNDSKCHPLAGYAANSPDFRFQTCQLAPQDYIARLTVIDDKQKTAVMDVRLRVLKGDYEDPATRLQSAAAAYQTLQSERFMSFFDTSFANYGTLSETIRRTFEGLASMTLNLRVSQASINCNEATVRADWQQNYTFKTDGTCDNLPAGTACQRVLFTQTEQLTTRMIRVADPSGSRILGWNIVDFQGDNGTVQGTPPGPRTVDTALPDLQVQGLTSSTGGVAPGINTFSASVQNVGSGPLSAPAKIRFAALAPDNTELAFDVEDVPIPLGVGQSINVLGKLDIPNIANANKVRIVANVNPSCTVAESKCDGNNIQQLDFFFGSIDLKVSNIVTVGTLIGTLPGAVTVDVTNIGSRSSVASAANLKLTLTSLGLTSDGVAVPSIAPGATVTLTVPFAHLGINAVPNAAGTQAITVGLTPASLFDLNPANDFATGSVAITGAKVDLQLSSLAFSAGTPINPPFLSGQSHIVSFSVKNIGNVPSAAIDSYGCKLASTTLGTANFTPLTLPSVGAGQTVAGVTFTFIVPINLSGADTLTCTVSQDPFETVSTLADNQGSLATQVNPNIDLQIVNVPVPNSADQMGALSSVSFGVQNIGLDTAPGGFNVVLTINGNLVTQTGVGPVAGGATLPMTLNYIVPQIGPAPQDISVPASLQVNTNAVVTETNTANNTVSRTLRLVDFTLAPITTSPIFAVSGRSFNATVTSVLPTTYPLPLNVTYIGAPAGLTNAGSQSGNILGVQLGSNSITGAPNTYLITPAATVQGVSHTASSPINLQLLPDLNPSVVAGFALSAGGVPQSFQVAITGGVTPVTLNLALPTGVTIAAGSPTPTNSITANSPSTVTWNLQSDLTAAIGGALTNIVVTVTDPGIGANNVNAGNKVIAPPYANGGFDNYIITGAGMISPHTAAGTGTDSFQANETVNFGVKVKNIGNLGQTGSLDVQITCSVFCGTPIITIPAPAPGVTSTANLLVPIAASPGSYTATLAIVPGSAPPQSSTADDSFAFPYDVFDFSVSNQATFLPLQNVPLNGPANYGISVSEFGPAASIPIALPLAVTSGGSTNTTAPSIVQGGLSYSIAMSNNGGVVSGTLDTVTATVTRTGFPGNTRTTSQSIKYYTASLDNITSGGLGDSSASHQLLVLGGSTVSLNFHLTGDFDATTPGTLAVNTSNGITTLVNSFSGTPGNSFSIDFTPSVGTTANGTETVIDLVYTVPNTNPVQQIVKHVFFLAVNPPDLSISMIPAGISTGRDFSSTANPWIAGEGIEFNVTVSNIGAGPSSPNLAVKLSLTTGLLSQTTIPSIPGHGSYTFLVHVRAPDNVGTASGNSISLAVDNDPLELLSTLGNNFTGVSIATSDWGLALVGAPSGDKNNPIVIPASTAGGTIVQAVTPSGGLIVTPITVVIAGVSSTISATAPAGTLTPPVLAPGPPQGTVSFSTGVSSGPGEYAVQLVGRVSDGGVTSERSTTVHINVAGTITPVIITSSISNALPTNPPSSCSGGCIVRQINGYLVDSLDLTATGGTGTVDLIFTDDNPIVSNVSVPSGSPGPQYLNAVAYNSPRPINFAPLDNNGAVTPGPANVIVSAVAATTAARGGPIQEKVGTQQTTLYFNIGDLLVSPSSACSIQIPPNGGTAHVVMSFLPLSGFNQPTLTYNWTSFGGALVSLASSSGTATFLNPGYSTATFDFTNHEAAGISSTVTFNLDVTIQSTNGSQATKHFAIPVSLSSTPCVLPAAHREGTVASSGFASSAGYWTRGSGGGAASSSIRRDRTSTASTLPDLQIKSTDVSISPSVPKTGDKIDVRFKVTNAGGGIAKQVPIALQVNGTTVASDKYDLNAGASTLGALQWVAKVPDPNIQTDRPGRGSRGGGSSDVTPPAPPSASHFDAKLVIDPAVTVPQASQTFKAVQLSKMMLRGGPAEPTTVIPMDRVFLEVGTICVGFRLTSGSGSECETGADVDLSIVDFASARFELIAQLGIADLGPVTAGAANLAGVQFGSRASLIVGHTYAVQLSGNKVGLMTIVRQLTPMQLAAEAQRRFGRGAIRIVSRLGGSTGAVVPGDVSGSTTRGTSDALTYFELAFTAQQ